MRCSLVCVTLDGIVLLLNEATDSASKDAMQVSFPYIGTIYEDSSVVGTMIADSKPPNSAKTTTHTSGSLNTNTNNNDHSEQYQQLEKEASQKNKVATTLLKLLSFEEDPNSSEVNDCEGKQNKHDDVCSLYNGNVCFENEYNALDDNTKKSTGAIVTTTTSNNNHISVATATHGCLNDNILSSLQPKSATANATKEDVTMTTNTTTTETTKSEIMIRLIDLFQFCMSLLVWPAMLTVPVILSSPSSPFYYKHVFPYQWYQNNENDSTYYSSLSTGTMNTTTMGTSYNDAEQHTGLKKPLGLMLGILAVIVGQFFTLIFFYWYRHYCGEGIYSGKNDGIHDNHNSARQQQQQRFLFMTKTSVQTKGAVPYTFSKALMIHLSQPEGFFILGMYLIITWMFNLLPTTYYNFHGTIHYRQVFYCLLCQDCYQYIMHRIEHDGFISIHPNLYKLSHKPHHRFINPILFDAFNGSTIDTIVMILIPLLCTAYTVQTNMNVWTYMAFGSIYANWLTLIHCEYNLPWDALLFSKIGFGTSSDHHVHHKYYKYNYGHLFMYWDYICHTYKNPTSFGSNIFTISATTTSAANDRKSMTGVVSCLSS